MGIIMIIAITGANSGVGFGTAIRLAKDNQIIMICRNKEKAEKAKETIIRKSGSSKVDIFIADLSDVNSLIKVGDEIKSKYNKIDILINNAGIIILKKELTDYGIEKTLAVNHLGHFLLTYLLLDLILTSTEPKIINVSSQVYSKKAINYDDINYENEKYTVFGAYSRSKFANILFTKKMARKYPEIQVNCVHPGIVGSNFAKSNGWYAKIAMNLIKPFSRSPSRSANASVYLVTEKINGSGGFYIDKSFLGFPKPIIKKQKTSSICNSVDMQDKLWAWSVTTINSIKSSPLEIDW